MVLRLIVGVAAVALVNAALLCTAHSWRIWPNSWGWANIALFDALLLWLAADTLFPRRAIYRFFRSNEEPLKPELRFWRKVAVAGSALAGLASCSIAMLQPSRGAMTGPTTIPDAALGPIFVLIGAFLASFGVMYTVFEKEKSDRANNTSLAIRDQLYSDRVSTILTQMQALIEHIKEKKGLRYEDMVPLEDMETKLGSLAKGRHPGGDDAATLWHLADYFMNSLDQMALGVRIGYYDLRAIELIIRPRVIRYAYLFAPYIQKWTKASFDANSGRWSAQTRTWEHYLWLVSNFQILESDRIGDKKQIVCPPDHIVGTRAGELYQPPSPSVSIPASDAR